MHNVGFILFCEAIFLLYFSIRHCCWLLSETRFRPDRFCVLTYPSLIIRPIKKILFFVPVLPECLGAIFSLAMALCVNRPSVYFVQALFVVWELCKYCGVISIILKFYLDWQFVLKIPSNPTYSGISGGLMVGEIPPVQGTVHGCCEKLCLAPSSLWV